MSKQSAPHSQKPREEEGEEGGEERIARLPWGLDGKKGQKKKRKKNEKEKKNYKRCETIVTAPNFHAKSLSNNVRVDARLILPTYARNENFRWLSH